MNLYRLYITTCIAIFSGVLNVSIATPGSGAPTVQSSALTVYNNGALVRQQLAFSTNAGHQVHILPGLPATLIPESIMLLLGADREGESINEFYTSPDHEGTQNSLHFTTNSPDVSVAKGVTLVYTFKDLTWQSQYTLKLSPNLDSLSLNCWIEIANKTAANFKAAGIQLVDGLAPQIDGNPSVQQKATLRAYNVSDSIDIQPNQVKRINWYSKQSLVSKQELRVSIGSDYLKDMDTKVVHPPVETWLSISNSKDVGLGIPMPRGQATLYYQDDQGNLELLGKADINALTDGQDLSVRVPSTQAEKMGKALISSQSLKNYEVDLDQTEYKHLSDRISEANYRLMVRNKTAKPITIRVTLDLPVCEEWVIVRENFGHVENSPRQLSWYVHVQPSGESDLKFRIRITWNDTLMPKPVA